MRGVEIACLAQFLRALTMLALVHPGGRAKELSLARDFDPSTSRDPSGSPNPNPNPNPPGTPLRLPAAHIPDRQLAVFVRPRDLVDVVDVLERLTDLEAGR